MTMLLAQLTVAQVLEFPADGALERILWIDPTGRGLYVIDIRLPSALPLFRDAAELERLAEEEAFRPAEVDPFALALAEDSIPVAHRKRRDKSWELIRPLVLDQPAIFQQRPRALAIKRVMAETGAPNPTIYRLLRRYWQRGMMPNALLPDFDRCGGRGKVKAVSEKKRGRVYREAEPGINVTPEMRVLFRAAVTRHYARNGRLNLAEAYQDMVAKDFSDRILDEATGRQILVTRPQIPTLRQFRYWLERDNDPFAIDRARRTPRIYDKDRRALLGSSTAETFGPGSRFQIDATIADVYLVSRYDARKIVGRPVLYVVIDVFSRMIVGVYVGLEGPSWVGAMMALANATSDKLEYCRQFGIDISAAQWPCAALPDALLGDRGEIAGGAIETLIRNFNVRVETAAPYRADWKGIVEQRFRLLPAKFQAYTPGYVAGDFRKRGGSDYRLDAELDIDDFTRIILLCVLYYNNQHPLREYEASPEMIAEDVEALPVDLWNWGIANLSGRLRSYPADLVRLSLLPSDQAAVTVHGIRFFGCFYSCPQAIEEHWFERARQRGIWKVRISYEPRCMDEIFLHDETGRARFLPCSLTDRSRHHRGRTLWEIDQINQEQRRQAKSHDRPRLEAGINLKDAISGILDAAHARRAALGPDTRSDRERVADIRSNRREERRDNQDREAFRFGQQQEAPAQVLPFPGPKAEEEDRAPDITDYLRLLREEENKDGSD